MTVPKRIGLPERHRPECITLPVRRGCTPSAKPAVRIFLGSEASQFRPERVFVWSIELVRDPSRIYEIHVMKELSGFDRSGWTTGFTNYRFAIPEFAGSGRAIYNDEDQIYLTDPAELFDLEMGEKGFLAISETESSVMLIDCERMAAIWTPAAVRTGRKKVLLTRAAEAGLFGALDPHWNARDGEYVAGRSHLLHYTTLHTQPWRPFPERFVYRDNPLGSLWHDLENDADNARFSLFDRERPSSRFAQAAVAASMASSQDHLDLQGPVRAADAKSIVRFDPSEPLARGSADAVVSHGGLGKIPEDDLPWVLDELFDAAERFVFAAIECRDQKAIGPTETETETSAKRIGDHFRAAASRHPEIRWELLVRRRNSAGETGDMWSGAGPRFALAPPRVWVVSGHRHEDAEAAEALCAALGWPTEEIAADLVALAPPWPDLLIASGAGSTSTAALVRAESHGRTKIVSIDADQGATDVDLSVISVSAGMFAHPRRFEVATPLVVHDSSHRAQVSERWREFFEKAPRPRIALFAGGGDTTSRLSAEALDALGQVVRSSGGKGGSLFALASKPHDGDIGILLPDSAHVATLCRGDDTYLAHLEWADEFIVSGDSERILADVCKTGKRVQILPVERRGSLERFRAAVARRADAAPLNNRGTVRPQQGLERLCSRLISRGIVRPPRDYRAVSEQLVLRGAATLIGSDETSKRVLDESKRVAEQVRDLLGVR